MHKQPYDPAATIDNALGLVLSTPTEASTSADPNGASCYEECIKAFQNIPADADLGAKCVPLAVYLRAHDPTVWTTRIRLLAACKVQLRGFEWAIAVMQDIERNFSGRWEGIVAAWRRAELERSQYERKRGNLDAARFERYWVELHGWYKDHKEDFRKLDATLTQETSFQSFASAVFSPVRSFEIHNVMCLANCSKMMGKNEDAISSLRSARELLAISPHSQYYEGLFRQWFGDLWDKARAD